MEFVKAIANISYETLDELKKFEEDDTLKNVDFLDLIAKVHPPLSGTLVTSDSTRTIHWQLILTEIGVCFSINSKLAKIFSHKLLNNSNSQNNLLKCHYLNGLCYARYDSDPLAPLKVSQTMRLLINCLTIDISSFTSTRIWT